MTKQQRVSRIAKALQVPSEHCGKARIVPPSTPGWFWILHVPDEAYFTVPGTEACANPIAAIRGAEGALDLGKPRNLLR